MRGAFGVLTTDDDLPALSILIFHDFQGDIERLAIPQVLVGQRQNSELLKRVVGV